MHKSQKISKFPKGYIFELTKTERNEVIKNFDNLEKEKQEVIEIFDNLKFSPALPKAFTEKGLYMLATILKSLSNY